LKTFTNSALQISAAMTRQQGRRTTYFVRRESTGFRRATLMKLGSYNDK